MNNKILRGELENDSIEHFRDPSTPKHNRGAQEVAPLNQAKGSARGYALRGISTRITQWKTN